MMKRLFKILLFAGIFAGMFLNYVSAIANEYNCGDIKIENELLKYKYVYTDNEYWLPLRCILEKLGAKVEWNGQNRQIYICYGGEAYIADLEADENESYNQFTLRKLKYKKSTDINFYLSLSGWGGGTGYRMINDSTYLHKEGMIRLLYNFGYLTIIQPHCISIIQDTKENREKYTDIFIPKTEVNQEAKGLLAMCHIWCDNAENIVEYMSENIDDDRFKVMIRFHSDTQEQDLFYWNESWDKILAENVNDSFKKYITDANTIIYKHTELNDVYLIKQNNEYIACGNVFLN